MPGKGNIIMSPFLIAKGGDVTVEIKVTTDDLVSVLNAAAELGRPRITIYRWVERGKIHGIRLGEILFIPRSEVERISKEQEAAKKAEAA